MKKKSLVFVLFIMTALLLPGCRKKVEIKPVEQSTVQPAPEDSLSETSTSEAFGDMAIAAPDVTEQGVVEIKVGEEYAKTHDGYYLKTADGSLYPLSSKLPDITIQSDKFGVPYTASESEDGKSGTDLYWRIDSIFNRYGIISCGEVPVPTVEEDEDYSIIFYTSKNYAIDDLPQLEIRSAPSPSPCTPFSFLFGASDYKLPSYGIYGEGRHYIGQSNGEPYYNTPFTLEDMDGTVMGSFTLDPREGLEIVDDSPFDDLWPWKIYRWSWYEGSAYKEVELPANCASYIPRSDPVYIDAELTKEGYYEYDVKDVLIDGTYIVNDFVIWVLDPEWDPFEEAGIEKENPTYYDYMWHN